MSKGKIAKVVCFALDLLQIAAAIGLIALTSARLLNVNISDTLQSKCLLDPTEGRTLSGTPFCIYIVVVGVVSLLVNMLFGCIRNFVKCVTLKMCGASQIVEVVGDIALAIWWGIAFAFAVRRGTLANQLEWPNRTERDGVIAIAFGGMSFFILDALTNIIDLSTS